jgi:hypothetical protein
VAALSALVVALVAVAAGCGSVPAPVPVATSTTRTTVQHPYPRVVIPAPGDKKVKPEPPPIRKSSNPGGLVARIIDQGDRERRRWLLGRRDPTAGVEEAAEACGSDASLRLVIHDGDTGKPVVVLKTPGPAGG